MCLNQEMKVLLSVLDGLANMPDRIYRYYPSDDAARDAAKILYDGGHKHRVTMKLASKGRLARLNIRLR